MSTRHGRRERQPSWRLTARRSLLSIAGRRALYRATAPPMRAPASGGGRAEDAPAGTGGSGRVNEKGHSRRNERRHSNPERRHSNPERPTRVDFSFSFLFSKPPPRKFLLVCVSRREATARIQAVPNSLFAVILKIHGATAFLAPFRSRAVILPSASLEPPCISCFCFGSAMPSFHDSGFEESSHCTV
jgi:hypothetical protein